MIRTQRDGAVASVTLDRPGRGNALTTAMKAALRDTLEDVAADRAVRAVLLTGAGRSFCTGQDLAEHAEALRRDPEQAFATVTEHYSPIVTALATMPKPVVAAVNGPCVGAGLGFALACDVRIAADTATFATAFTAIGLACDSGLSATLARAVGAARARELLLLAEPLTAGEALAWGMAGRVVAAADLADAAAGLAQRLAAGPTRAYAEAKRIVAGAWAASLPAVLQAEAAAQERLGRTVDHHRAIEAFLDRQTPTFTGE